jgi:phosphoenolpyruvate phosphomutase
MNRAGLAQIMAAHSPLSAVLAEEAGFDGLWASGFELSALYGLPDVSLITMTQHLDVVRAIAERSSLPIVADIDTGFGNAVNVVHAIEQYERAGAAAVVIEDKTFPKVTSLVAGGRQELVRIEEFQGKLEAACAARKDKDFLIIGRTEALIAGLILVHSKQKTADEVESFVHAWTGNAPIAIVPTSYPEMNAARIAAFGKIKMMIYGNHAIRASVTAMQKVFARIKADGGIHQVNSDLVSVEEIFRLQRMEKMKATEKTFMR